MQVHLHVITSLCAAAMQHVFAMASHVTALLNGATDPDPSQHGMTTEEEQASSSKPQVTQHRLTSPVTCRHAIRP